MKEQRRSSHVSDVIVLGGGAAGLMCAAIAGARARRVQVLEKTGRCGRKILMSGGGRCNFTNLYSGPDNFLSANPHFCKSALSRYSPDDFIALVERHGIAYHEKERGQLFCDESSKQIVAMLLAECEAAGVAITTGVAIESVVRDADGLFTVATADGSYRAPALVVATGGLSIPRMGASGFGFELARQFGLAVRSTRAALVPFTLADQSRSRFAALSGLGLDVEAKCNGASFDAGLLFTHRGLSGPAMLQVSSYWQPGSAVAVDFLSAHTEKTPESWLAERAAARPDALLSNVLAEILPKRLAACLCGGESAGGIDDRRLREYGAQKLDAVVQGLCRWLFEPAGTEGYRTAEVTLGGVDTRELSSTTMAAKAVDGLYFIGEVVDVTGHLGGHNFQWAWASGQAAGAAV